MADVAAETLDWFLSVVEELKRENGGKLPTPKRLAAAANISVEEAKEATFEEGEGCS